MAGNVWEWTLDREKPNQAARIIRGGAAYSTPDELLSFRRQGAPPGGSNYGGLNLLGFRCVKPLAPEPPREARQGPGRGLRGWEPSTNKNMRPRGSRGLRPRYPSQAA
jgi:hypothetical protein